MTLRVQDRDITLKVIRWSDIEWMIEDYIVLLNPIKDTEHYRHEINGLVYELNLRHLSVKLIECACHCAATIGDLPKPVDLYDIYTELLGIESVGLMDHGAVQSAVMRSVNYSLSIRDEITDSASSYYGANVRYKTEMELTKDSIIILGKYLYDTDVWAIT